MNKWLLTALFFTINFLIFLLPRLMSGTISNESVIFWAVWVNSLFFLFLILPYKASYFFEENKSIFGLSIDKLFNPTSTTVPSSSEKSAVSAVSAVVEAVESIAGNSIQHTPTDSHNTISSIVDILRNLINKNY